MLCAEEKVDLAVIQRIKKEAFQNSKVMDHMFWLTDVYGPRLTGSPGLTAAANWAVRKLKDYGIENAAAQPWGKFGRSWRLAKFSISLEEPEYAPLIGFPLAWSANTDGPLVAEPLLAPLAITDRLNVKKTEEELQKFYQEQKGKLRGKIVLLTKPKDLTPATTAPASRFSETELAHEAEAPTPESLPHFDLEKMMLPEDPKERSAFFDLAPLEIQTRIWDYEDSLTDKINQFLTREGAVAAIVPSYHADAGTVFGEAAGDYKQDAPMAEPRIALTVEHYNRIARLLDRKVPVKLALEVRSTTEGANGDGLNIIAEIPGGGKKDQVVIVVSM